MTVFDAAIDSWQFLDCHNALNYSGPDLRRLPFTGLYGIASGSLGNELLCPIATLETLNSGDTRDRGAILKR